MATPKFLQNKEGPEAKIQRELILFLQQRRWIVKETHGNLYQSGFPDLYATNRIYGPRWIECKNPLNYKFTNAQLRDFPVLCANGSPIWILTAATEEEYQKLFRPYNWYQYLK